MIKWIFILKLIMNYSFSYACSVDGQDGIIEKNNLWIDTHSKNVSEIDESKFNQIIDKVSKIYKPIIENNGGKLIVEKDWEDGTVNAYASRKRNKWFIHMFGGFARHEVITPDAFTLVVCHEIGHHLGGAPKKTRSAGRNGTRKRWATNEGQADYWATLKCLRKSWRGEDHKKVLSKLEIPHAVKENCDDQFSREEDKLICQRGAMAGLSTSMLFQSLRKETESPKFETPDSHIVSSHFHRHPATQCRLDTYFQGALCAVSEFNDVDQTDVSLGNCNRVDSEVIGVRPLCWFKPSL